MLFQSFPDPGEPQRNGVPAKRKTSGQLPDPVGVPVASHEKDPAFLIQRLQKAAYAFGSFFRLDLIFDPGGGRKTVRDLVQRDVIAAAALFRRVRVVLFE